MRAKESQSKTSEWRKIGNLSAMILFGTITTAMLAYAINEGREPLVAPRTLVPEPGYVPTAGDRVALWNEGKPVPAALWMWSYGRMKRSLAVGDADGIEAWVESGTGVLVLEVHGKDWIDNPGAAVVRVLDGPLAKKQVYVDASHVAKLVEKIPQNSAESSEVSRPGSGPAD